MNRSFDYVNLGEFRFPWLTLVRFLRTILTSLPLQVQKTKVFNKASTQAILLSPELHKWESWVRAVPSESSEMQAGGELPPDAIPEPQMSPSESDFPGVGLGIAWVVSSLVVSSGEPALISSVEL
jgi:hypothetical protein